MVLIECIVRLMTMKNWSIENGHFEKELCTTGNTRSTSGNTWSTSATITKGLVQQHQEISLIKLQPIYTFKELGQRIKSESGDPHSFQFLIQRVAVAIQRGNTAAVLGTFPAWLFNCVLLFCIFCRCMHLSFKNCFVFSKKKIYTFTHCKNFFGTLNSNKQTKKQKNKLV